MRKCVDHIRKGAGSAAQCMPMLCSLFMLCVIPLLFNDAFFDINRVKVNAVIAAVPVLAALWACASLLSKEEEKGRHSLRHAMPPIGMLLLFLAACLASCAMAGFVRSTLTGEDGRYCGLFFVLACSAAFIVTSSGTRMPDWVMLSATACAALCAALGVLNALGVDPLGFYAQIKKGQEQVFMSTIGHFDFFGTFLVMMSAAAGGYAVFSENRWKYRASLAASVLMMLGMHASRTDSAFLGMHLVCMALVSLSGNSLRFMARAFLLWAAAMFTLPVMNALLPLSPFGVEISGLPLFLCESGLALAAGALMLTAAAICWILRRKGRRAPGKHRVMCIGFGLLAIGIIGLLLVIVYFTWISPDTQLGSAAFMLRFNDHWGSLRGFVYTRSLRAYADFTLMEKLFGRGMESTLATLTPYFDNPDMLVYGVFNDTHCQPLQMLLTCGAFGAAAFVAFYLSMLYTVGRHMKDDPLLCGVFAMLIGYLVIMAINVTQPILISTYLSLCAAAIGRIAANRWKGGKHGES